MDFDNVNSVGQNESDEDIGMENVEEDNEEEDFEDFQ